VTLLGLSGESLAVEGPMALSMAVLTIFVASRIGRPALAFRFLAFNLPVAFPLSLDSSRWCAGRSFFVLMVLASLASYGFHAALGGKPVFGAATLDEG
jgi:hypothetical protein